VQYAAAVPNCLKNFSRVVSTVVLLASRLVDSFVFVWVIRIAFVNAC